MDFPASYKYSKDHEWVLMDNDNVAIIGITGYAIEHLGDIVHIEFPEPEETFDSGASFGTIESTKTVSDCYMPVSGKVIEVNDALLTNLENLSEDPYDDGWLIKVELSSKDEVKKLLSVEEYEAYINEISD